MRIFHFLLVIFFFISVPDFLTAQSRTAYTAVGAYGDWSNTATWKDSVVPIPGAGYDTVIIDADAGVQISSSMTFNGVIIVKNQLDIIGSGTTLTMSHSSWIKIEAFPFPLLMFDPDGPTRATQSVKIGSLTYPGSDAFYTDSILGPSYITAGGTGSDWSSTGTWTDNFGDNRLPAAGDSVIIPVGVDVHVPASTTIDLTGRNTTIMVYGRLELDGDSGSEISMDGGSKNYVYIHTFNTSTQDGSLEVIGPVIQNGNYFSASADSEPGSDGMGDANTVGGFGSVEDGDWVIMSSPLPVKLRSFDALVTGDIVLLKWQTSEEIDFSHFEVQRSYDGKEFYTVGSVKGKGDVDLLTDYQYFDQSAALGLVYYRLKSIDFDASFEYSSILPVFLTEVNRQVIVYPNPVRNNALTLSVDHTVSDKAVFALLNETGDVIFTDHLTGRSTAIELPANLSMGVYFLKVSDGDRESIVKMLKY